MIKINKNQKVKKIYILLVKEYPQYKKTGLHFNTPFELLVSTILSAQSTDKQVNNATDELFKHYNTPEDFAKIFPEELEPFIVMCGLYKNKSRNIIKASKILMKKYNSQVPDSLKELVELPGVGRKTANVVLSAAFGQPAMPVDTHVFRVSKRLGLVEGNTVEKVERELLYVVPESIVGDFHYLLILHGRNVCKSRNPQCMNCILQSYCISVNI
ncbi:MAG: endonuclease III [Clostridiales bacterium]|nr:endonuclease III [Clostridiales bacterium]MCF8021658.1 endonuclease III [Clostridiales bacterium]